MSDPKTQDFYNLWAKLPDILNKLNAGLGVTINGSLPEVASAQDTLTAGVAETYTRANEATQMEVFVESGNVRVRTDGQAATATTGEPLGEGFSKIWATASLSIYPITNATVTVVSR